MRKLFILSILLVIALSQGKGQEGPEVGEAPDHLYVHIDREMYVTGEQLWYAIYLFQPTHTIQSRIVHVDIIDPEGRVRAHHQHPIQGNRAVGDFFLDPNWVSGMYTFRAYTLWNHNFDPKFSFVANLPIYSSTQKIPVIEEQKEQPNTEEMENLVSTPSFPTPLIELLQEKPNPRDSIQIRCSFSGIPSNEYPLYLSVSVAPRREYDWDNFPEPISRRQEFKRLSNDPLNPQRELAPQKSLAIWGEIQEEAQTEPLAFALTDSTSVRFPIVEEGSFQVEFPDFYGQQSLQIMREQQGPLQVEWGKVQAFSPPSPNPASLTYNEAIKEAILQSRKRKVFQQLFELPGLAQYPPASPSRFVLKPDQQFLAEDYIAFRNMEEFMRETVHIRLKGKEPTPSIRLLDMDRNLYFKKKPLFMVNGYLTRDEGAVLAIPWREVERVELFLSSFRLLSQFAALGANGVLAVYTRGGKTPSTIVNSSFIEPIEGFYTPLVFTPPDLDRGEEQLAIPDLREVEYWNPNITLSAPGPIDLSYRLSDAKGEFILRLEGVTSQGNPIQGEIAFEVK